MCTERPYVRLYIIASAEAACETTSLDLDMYSANINAQWLRLHMKVRSFGLKPFRFEMAPKAKAKAKAYAKAKGRAAKAKAVPQVAPARARGAGTVGGLPRIPVAGPQIVLDQWTEGGRFAGWHSLLQPGMLLELVVLSPGGRNHGHVAAEIAAVHPPDRDG
eukprot:6490862-Amphidinium_carterae.5